MGSTEAATAAPQACQECALAPGQADALVALSQNAGWNQVAADWRFMLQQGRGVGFADQAGRPVASAIHWPVGGRLDWISMVLTHTDWRKRGFGTRLLQRCIDAATASQRAAGLDATELGRPLYATMGFRELYTLARWRLERVGVPTDVPAGIAIRAATAADIDALAGFDRLYSGMNRATLLAHLVGRAPRVAMVATAGGKVRGYVLGRDGRTASQIGPIVAESDAVALALLSRAVAAADLPVMLDVPDRHAAIGAWIAAAGGTAPRRFWRMVLGDAPGLDDPRCLYAIAGPELG
ncbi:MAG: GNAT family N-acetyltransferase [Rhodospirillales bacterium]|nr:GNAT family N-acetyltransferase [Rhodospirillales bacterium]